MEKTRIELEAQKDSIAKKLEETGISFEERLNLKGEVHRIEMKIKNVKPDNSDFECLGCGS